MAFPLVTIALTPHAGFFSLNGLTFSYHAAGSQLQILNSDGVNVLTLDGVDATAALAFITACRPVIATNASA